MKKLGFGLMRLPKINNENDNIDIEQVKEMADYFMDKGFTYFDTAWFYHDQTSEAATKKALVDRYERSSFILADKLPVALLKPEDKSEDELEAELEDYFTTQLERTGAGYFDYYLLHSLNKDHFETAKTYKAYEFILEKKKQGLIKKVGFSFHDKVEVLEEIFDAYPDLEFVQLQINYLDLDHELIQSRKIYDLARERNMDIIIMEPLKGGTLASLPKEAEDLMKAYNPDASVASWALRYAAGLEGVFMVLSGMSNLVQVKDNVKTMENFQALNNEEIEILKKVVDLIQASSAIQCTECEYCLNDCPVNIPIPSYFAYYNRDKQGLGFNNDDKYMDLKSRKTPPSECIECGNCESICPQHLKVIDLLKEVDGYFERK